MATVKDSTDLLKTEADREEALLAKEKKQLQEMEKNAKRAEMERKRQLKNVRISCVGMRRVVTDLLQEHPVLRKLGEASGTDHRIPADLKIADVKNPQLTFDGVRLNPLMCASWY